MTAHPVVPAWARDFDNSPRHCWEDVDGKRWIEDGGFPVKACEEPHDPKLAGQTEWLRFVRGFGAVAESFPHDNPFAPKNTDRYFLLNEVDGHRTSDGRVTYSETYLRRSHTGEWGVKPVFRVFLDNEAGWARIECYDEGYVGSCELTLGAVERSYRMEVTR